MSDPVQKFRKNNISITFWLPREKGMAFKRAIYKAEKEQKKKVGATGLLEKYVDKIIKDAGTA